MQGHVGCQQLPVTAGVILQLLLTWLFRGQELALLLIPGQGRKAISSKGSDTPAHAEATAAGTCLQACP